MKLVIENIKQFGEHNKNIVNKLKEYIELRFKNTNIVCTEIIGMNVDLEGQEDTQRILVVKGFDKENKFLKSSKTNMIKLKEGDSRIAKFGKATLDSHRLTEKQYNELLRIFNEHLDSIGIECDIYLQEFQDDPMSMTYIRKDNQVVIKEWLKPKSFTEENV